MPATIDRISASTSRTPSRRAIGRTWHHALHVVEWQLMAFRAVWRSSVLTSFVQPLMYVAGMGLGVGALVNRNASSTSALGGVRYVTYLAPGLLATTAMMVASMECMWPVLAGFKWQRTFHAMVASPLEPADIVLGEAIYVGLRSLLSAAAVAVALTIFPATRSSGLLLAVPFAGLCGLAFGMPIAAYAATRERDSAFPAMQRFVITPLFLFGGAFYPLKQLPVAAQALAKFAPLWHGVELCRAATLHRLQIGTAAVHVAYLLMWIAVGLVATVHSFRKKLLI